MLIISFFVYLVIFCMFYGLEFVNEQFKVGEGWGGRFMKEFYIERVLVMVGKGEQIEKRILG